MKKTAKTMTKLTIAAITCSAITVDCVICQHFGIMPVYWFTAIMLAAMGSTIITEVEEEA